MLYLITDQVSSVLLRGQLAHLVADGYHVVVGCSLSEDASPALFDPGCRVVPMPYVRQPLPLMDLWALWRTIRLIRQVRPALVNASTPKAGLLGMVAAVICRIPVRVYVVRGLRFEGTAGRRRWLLRALERLTHGSATHIVFNSPSLRTMAVAEGLLPSAKGIVIGSGSGNGVDPRRFSDLPTQMQARSILGLENADGVIGFVGRLTRDKGTDDLVAVFEELAADFPRLHLLLVGSHEKGDPLSPQTEGVISSHPSIIDISWIDDTGLAFCAMDVLVFPSYREGMPNVVLEAQLCRVPVVAYAATGTIDAIQPDVTGLLVPTGNRSALSGAVRTLLDDPDRRADMGEAGSQWVRADFDPEAIWTKLTDLYRSWIRCAE